MLRSTVAKAAQNVLHTRSTMACSVGKRCFSNMQRRALEDSEIDLQGAYYKKWHAKQNPKLDLVRGMTVILSVTGLALWLQRYATSAVFHKPSFFLLC